MASQVRFDPPKVEGLVAAETTVSAAAERLGVYVELACGGVGECTSCAIQTVENPFALADLVLGPEWTNERLKRLIGSGERTIRLPQPLPIHLVYNTLVVNEAGAITTFEDLYGFHRLVRTALERLS